jgi:hypothetical protein
VLNGRIPLFATIAIDMVFARSVAPVCHSRIVRICWGIVAVA